jgi:Ca2+-binding EF-hand superfamily protein
MRIHLALLALVALGCAAPVVRAFPTAAQIKTAFDELDTSHNGAISADEWDRASFILFHATDKNNDNFIDQSELAGSAIAQDTFLRADTDHDGRLSVGEFMEIRRAIFRVADIDHDDNLSFVEFELLVVMERVGWIDRNHDGRIELSELKESLVRAFEQFDTDHDGRLSTMEAAFMPTQEFTSFDANHDGQLTVEEFVAGYRAVLLGG